MRPGSLARRVLSFRRGPASAGGWGLLARGLPRTTDLPGQGLSSPVVPGRSLAAAAVPSDFDVLPGDEPVSGERPAVVQAYDSSGFTVGGIDYSGPVLCVGKQLALSWGGGRVVRAGDVTPDSLAVLEVLRPRPELLLLGTGATPLARGVPQETREYLVRLGVRLDVLSTRHAAATHNFLSEEGRSVVTALLLPDATE